MSTEIKDEDLPYPPDQGKTHYEGCWQNRGHHNCAVVEISRLKTRQQDHLQLIRKISMESIDQEEADELAARIGALIAEVGTLRAQLRTPAPPCEHAAEIMRLEVLEHDHKVLEEAAARLEQHADHLLEDIKHLQHEPGPTSCAGFAVRHHTLEAALEPLRNDIVEAGEINADWEEVCKVLGWMPA